MWEGRGVSRGIIWEGGKEKAGRKQEERGMEVTKWGKLWKITGEDRKAVH